MHSIRPASRPSLARLAMSRRARRPFFWILAPLLVGFAQSSSAQTAKPQATAEGSRLVGKWDAVKRSENNVGSVLEFRANGQMDAIVAAMIDAKYRVRGNTLTVRFGADTNSTEVRYRLAGDTMIQSDASTGGEMRLIRIAGAPHSIVGVWRFRHPAGGEAIVEYTDGGNAFLRLPLANEAGQYTVLRNQIIAQMRGATEPNRVKFAFAGDTLIVTPAKGSAKRYVRSRFASR